METEFWKKWKNVSKLERNAIAVLKEGRRIVLSAIPRSKIVSIYAGGSLLRRELTSSSDVDMWVITSDANGQKLVSKLVGMYSGKFKPELGLSGYSLWELKTGKPLKYLAKKMRTWPKRFVKKLDDYCVIYGKKLNRSDFAMRSDRDDLRVMIGVFYSKFLPMYYQGKFGFQDVLKQVFWLADLELSIKGAHPPHSWKELVKLTDKNHIARLALKLRHSKPDKKTRDAFIVQLKKYLKDLRLV